MRSVLVPLDGSALAEAILPDAVRLAGEGGRLVLVRDAPSLMQGEGHEPDEEHVALEHAESYLESIAEQLRSEPVTVEVHALEMEDAAVAIDQASRIYSAGMIAASTHGLTQAERWRRGSIAWRALVRSPIPVLLRHIAPESQPMPDPADRRVLVPLDGSALAEKALPLARELAAEWRGTTYLTEVIPNPMLTETLLVEGLGAVNQAREYLLGVERRVDGNVRASVLEGDVVESLVTAVEAWGITDIVMTSHGRTGVSRVIIGSIADDLIQRLHCPIIVLPPLVTLEWNTQSR